MIFNFETCQLEDDTQGDYTQVVENDEVAGLPDGQSYESDDDAKLFVNLHEVGYLYQDPYNQHYVKNCDYHYFSNVVFSCVFQITTIWKARIVAQVRQRKLVVAYLKNKVNNLCREDQ